MHDSRAILKLYDADKELSPCISKVIELVEDEDNNDNNDDHNEILSVDLLFCYYL